MRIFLTGATGVVGRRLIPMLTTAGHRITAIGRTPEKRERLERAGAAAVAVDLFDPAAVHRAVAGHDVVINLATHIPSSSTRMFLPGAWRENDRIRREASAILVEGAIAGGVQRFIQESFAPIYQSAGADWVDERFPMRPARYNRSVLDAERAAERFSASGGTGVVLRFAGFYGPDARHVHEMIRLAEHGWAPLPGHADAYFSSISHDDAATAVAAALTVPAGIYNVADDEPLTRREYADALAQALDVPPLKLPPAWLARLGGSLGELLSRSLRLSNRKLRSASGWAPGVSSARHGLTVVMSAIRGAGLTPRGELDPLPRSR